MNAHDIAALPADMFCSDEEARSRGMWFWYRNAREWGKPVIWSVRYAQNATHRFAR